MYTHNNYEMQSKVTLPDIKLEDLHFQDHLLVYLWFTFSEDAALLLLFGSGGFFFLPICKRRWEKGKNQVKMTHVSVFTETRWCQVSCQEHDVGEWSYFFPTFSRHCTVNLLPRIGLWKLNLSVMSWDVQGRLFTAIIHTDTIIAHHPQCLTNDFVLFSKDKLKLKPRSNLKLAGDHLKCEIGHIYICMGGVVVLLLNLLNWSFGTIWLPVAQLSLFPPEPCQCVHSPAWQR